MQTGCFWWKICIKKTSDFGLETGSTVEYNNFEYVGVDVINKCSTLAAAHVDLEHSGRGRAAFTMAVR